MAPRLGINVQADGAGGIGGGRLRSWSIRRASTSGGEEASQLIDGNRACGAGITGWVGEARGTWERGFREDSVSKGSAVDQIGGLSRWGDIIWEGARLLPRRAINPGNHNVSDERFNSAIGCAVDLSRCSSREAILE